VNSISAFVGMIVFAVVFLRGVRAQFEALCFDPRKQPLLRLIVRASGPFENRNRN
jgi:hypothetical protein